MALLASLAAACSSPVETPPPIFTDTVPFVVSNPVAVGSGGGNVVQGSSGQVAFVSLAPGTVPGGTTVSIRVHRTGVVVSAALVDGGLDPVAVPAVAGDTISLTATGSAGQALYVSTVPPRRPPVIVRTRPPKHKRDVPVNLVIQVVFSEPIDVASLTPQNFVLRSGSSPVAGQLTFANPEQTIVELIPDQDLAVATEYELLLSVGIRDLEGTPLETEASISFSTAATAPPQVQPGELAVTTVTTGTDLAPGEYWTSVDGDAGQAIPVNGGLTIRDVPPGPHSVALTGVGPNCMVAGTNPRTATVTSGQTARVEFAVTCALAAVTQLAFVRDEQIYLVNSGGTDLVQLTHTPPGVSNRDPAWSPDGQRLAFASNRAGGWDIYVMDSDGSNVVRRTGGGYNVEPTWSPDGRTIAFTSLQNGSAGVWVIDADGATGSRVLLDRPGWDANPAWSPEGQKITFTSDWRAYDFVYDLYVMNANGLEIRPLLEGPFFWADGLTFYFQSAWSPDGQKIAVVVCGWNYANCYPDQSYPQTSTIAVVNADGSGLRAIAQAGGEARPTWSPDGRAIAFASYSCYGCQPSLRFVRVDGSAEGLILINGHSPAWRP